MLWPSARRACSVRTVACWTASAVLKCRWKRIVRIKRVSVREVDGRSLISLRSPSPDSPALDGFPATQQQAGELAKMIQEFHLTPMALQLEIPDDVVRKRAAAAGRQSDQPKIIE